MRFRVTKGKVMVIPPGGAPYTEQVNLVYDSANNTFGIQVVGGQLAGHCFFVAQAALKACRDTGTESETLKQA